MVRIVFTAIKGESAEADEHSKDKDLPFVQIFKIVSKRKSPENEDKLADRLRSTTSEPLPPGVTFHQSEILNFLS